MSDLISREAVMEYLKEQGNQVEAECEKERSIIHSEALKGMKCCLEGFNSFVLTLPVAYNVDKVVELMEETKPSEEDCDVDLGCCMRSSDIDRCIDIVREGGVE